MSPLAGQSSPIVKGSQVTLGQVFLNLLLNACEAQPSGGEVTISTHQAEETALIEMNKVLQLRKKVRQLVNQ